MRYDIERNRRIRQVRTVVWEDGAARPLLPDSSSSWRTRTKKEIRYRICEMGYLLSASVRASARSTVAPLRYDEESPQEMLCDPI